MRTIDLKCRDSFASPVSGCRDLPQEALFLGHYGQIYLFFDLPADPGACVLQRASLILFKLPYIFSCGENDCAGYPAGQYTLYPLLDFFSAFGRAFSPPAVDFSRRVCYQDFRGCSYTEIDVTQIVKDWSDGRLENRGILLTGSPHSPCLYYASDRYEILWMRPLIRLTCGETEKPGVLRAVPCEVKINAAEDP